jgi:hypothetical protein
MPEAEQIKELLEKHHLLYRHEGTLKLSQRGRQVLQQLQSVALMEVVFEQWSSD